MKNLSKNEIMTLDKTIELITSISNEINDIIARKNEDEDCGYNIDYYDEYLQQKSLKDLQKINLLELDDLGDDLLVVVDILKKIKKYKKYK